jgi:hypothetical protein
MGQVAREHGFQRPFLSALCDPSAGLTIGCIVLAAKLAAGGGNVARGLALWNGGGNPDYASQILARVVDVFSALSLAAGDALAPRARAHEFR